jgi:ABC-2 type transport system permease protein
MTFNLLWRLVACNVVMTLEYRAAFLIYMIQTVISPLIALSVWLAVSAQGVALPYDRSQLVTYYVLVSVVSMLTNTWAASYVAQNIRRGDLSGWLLRPTPYISGYIGNNIGEKVIKLPLLLPLVAIVGLVFGSDLQLPPDPLAWLLFLASLPLAGALAFLLDFVIGSLAFWIEDVNGLVRMQMLARAFLAGQLVPLALFPPWMDSFLGIQPFRYTVSFPLEIVTGRLAPAAIAQGFAWQAGYCILLWACYRLLWRYGLRRYAAAGA